ncbi:hypothetical protein N7490_006627 [Penicillium lividum]|nr:hypothetical protein N7490_006627 [Penicillium lividum]
MPKVPTSSRNLKGKTSNKTSQRASDPVDSSRRVVQAMAAGVEAKSNPTVQDDRLRQILASKSKAAKNGAPADDSWKVVHFECLKVLDQAVEDDHELQNKMSREREQSSQLMQQLRAENRSANFGLHPARSSANPNGIDPLEGMNPSRLLPPRAEAGGYYDVETWPVCWAGPCVQIQQKENGLWATLLARAAMPSRAIMSSNTNLVQTVVHVLTWARAARAARATVLRNNRRDHDLLSGLVAASGGAHFMNHGKRMIAYPLLHRMDLRRTLIGGTVLFPLRSVDPLQLCIIRRLGLHDVW